MMLFWPTFWSDPRGARGMTPCRYRTPVFAAGVTARGGASTEAVAKTRAEAAKKAAAVTAGQGDSVGSGVASLDLAWVRSASAGGIDSLGMSPG